MARKPRLRMAVTYVAGFDELLDLVVWTGDEGHDVSGRLVATRTWSRG